MFYSAKPLKINNMTSVVDTSQVFTGQYWDEFGITPYLLPDRAKVLMLGLAWGGGVRPLLSSSKQIFLHTVDLNSHTNQVTQDNFLSYFPKLHLKIETADAQKYLRTSKEKWDAIWVDIYADDGYAPLMTEKKFIHEIKSSMNPIGIALFNLFGIPNQFGPLVQNGPQSYIFSLIHSCFSHTRILPYRRNLTVIASNSPIQIYPTEPHPELSAIDKTAFKNFKNRVLNLLPNETSTFEKPPADQMQFSAIDQKMRAHWQTVIGNLSLLGVQISHPMQLLDLIQDCDACNEWLKKIGSEEAWIEFLPILCAGETHLRDLNVDWIFSWTVENCDFLAKRLPRIYRQIWLPQLWSMVLHPSKRFRKYYFELLPLMIETGD